jgi:PAS domain S-box-containing protein
VQTHEDSGSVPRRARFDMADAAVVLVDARGVVTSWSREAERLLGISAADAVGREAKALLVPEDAERMPSIMTRCRRDSGWVGLLSAQHHDDRPVRVMVRVVPVGPDENPDAWVALVAGVNSGPGWDMSRSVLERLATDSPVGIAIVDTELRYVWSNTALEQFGGGPPQHRLGRTMRDIQPGLPTKEIEKQMRRVLETGRPVIGFEHVGRTRAAPHRDHSHSMSFVRLEDDLGHPIGVYYTVVDNTDRYRVRQRLALLDRASQYIGRTLDVMQTAQDLADVAVPDLADFVAVDLLEPVVRGGETSPGRVAEQGATPVLLRAGHQSVNPGVPEAVVEIGGRASYFPDSPPVRSLLSGDPWREERLDPLALEWACDIPGGRAARFLDLGLHTAIVVPIRARGVTLGVTTFFRRRRDEPFDPDDQRLAEEFVARAAVCIDNARRYTRERSAAVVLQQSLLPHGTLDQEAVEVASTYLPADALSDVGGDWFDVIPLSGARVALVVGDVVGHGIDAAATMGRLRTAVQTLAALDVRPEELLAHLDDLVGRIVREERRAAASGAATALGASCLYLVYDPVAGECCVASADHPAPAVLAPDGSVSFPDVPLGPGLGVGGLPFESVDVALPEGSVLALFTDGLLATRPPSTDSDAALGAGRERLRRALRDRQQLPLNSLCRTVVDELLPERPEDDLALLLAKTRRLGSTQVASWDLPTDPAYVARARELAQRQLRDWGLERLAFTTELVVSELVTNAIRYAAGPIRLRLLRERSLICEVFDTGATAPHLRHPRTTDEGGRGLFLISQFTQRWGTRYTTQGKIIWAEQPLEEVGEETV